MTLSRRIALSAVAACLAFPARAAPAAPESAVPHVSVVGTATADAEPDTATLTVGVETNKPTAVEAAGANAVRAAAVLKAVKDQGFDQADVVTEDLSVAPVFEDDINLTGPGRRIAVSYYHAAYLVSVRIHGVEKAGLLVSRVMEAGANVYRGLTFSVSDKEARAKALRAKAVDDARAKAEAYAAAAHARLGRLLVIDPAQEGESRCAGPTPPPAAPAPAAPALAPAPAPAGAGRVTLKESVALTWELVQDKTTNR